MSGFVYDLLLGLRMLRNNPGFSAVAVLAFALGTGANSAIFSVVNSVLLRPMDYFDPERLIVAEHAGPSPVAPATFLDWKNEARSFEQMAAAQAWGGSLRTSERPEAVVGLRVSANLFSLLGVPPILGRTFSSEEDRDGAAPVVVLGYSLWQRSFGGARDILGRQVEIDGLKHSVVGVMPPSFQFAPFWVTKAEIWAPLLLGNRRTDRTGKSLRVFGRLRRGVPVQQAQAELSAITHRLAQQFPDTTAKETVSVVPLRERVVGGVRPMLLTLLGAVAFILLIACANVANLMLARAAGRRRELAVRLALGASRWKLARQAISESAVLAALGGLIGLGLTYAAVHAVSAALPFGTLPRQREVGVDLRVLLFSGTLSILTAVLAGLFPALHSSRAGLNEALKEGGRGGSEGMRAHRTRGVLVATEVALAFVLLIGAGLMVRSFAHLLSQDAGFDPANLLTLEVSVSGTRQADPSRRERFYQAALERISALPGVRSASAINHAPITGDVWGMRFRIADRPEPLPGEWPNAVYRVVAPGYFSTMRTPIVRGRDFDARDDQRSQRVVIVNESLASKHWSGADPLGKRIATANDPNWLTVAGVVRDLKQSDWQANPREEIYFPLRQSPDYLSAGARHYEFLTFVVRVDSRPAEMSSGVRHAIEAIDSNVLVSNMVTMERAVATNTWRQRLSLLLLGVFGLIALVLAVIGIYGVISHVMLQRTHEIGIRIACGASQRDVLMHSVMQGLAPVAAGTVAGGASAVLLTRLMSAMLFGVKPTDPVTFAVVGALMLASGLFAAFRPALRASRLDPMIALRHQ